MKISTTIAAPREKVFTFLTEFDRHPRVSKAFKTRKLLLRMSNELHSRGHVELQGRKLVEEGRYTPYPPDKILVEENFPGFGRSEGTIELSDVGGSTRVEVEMDFRPFARRLRWYKALRGKRWVRAYLQGAVLKPFKKALENPSAAETPVAAEASGDESKEAPRGVLFDKEAEARAREEIKLREGKPASAGVSPSGESRKK